LEIRWIAHSWFQIKTEGTVIHIDPSDLSSKRLQGMPEDAVGTGKADLILITHNHSDHCRKEMVDALSKRGTVVLAPKSCSGKLGAWTKEIKPGGEFQLARVTVRAVDAYNTPEGASIHKLHRRGECLGYLVTAEGKTVYHAGDTDMIPEMDSLGAIEIALLPIGGRYTMDAEEAAKAVARINPRIVVPMHIIDADPQDFRAKVEAKAKARVAILREGEPLALT
jgi:L-ascorbate metabolism protein UlaG (beta-lactamase superfamily)